MHIFLVLTRYMNGLQDERIFIGLRCVCYIAEAQSNPVHSRSGNAGDRRIGQPGYGVYDKLERPYRDTRNFEGVYGSPLDAKRAVGDQGRVLRHAIHINGIDFDGQNHRARCCNKALHGKPTFSIFVVVFVK